MPVLRPAEQAALNVLQDASEPLTVRAVSDATGLHISTTVSALATLHGHGLASRRRDRRTWLCTPYPAARACQMGADTGGDSDCPHPDRPARAPRPVLAWRPDTRVSFELA